MFIEASRMKSMQALEPSNDRAAHHCGKGFCVSFAFRQSLIHNHNSIDGLTAADPLLRCWRCLRKDNVDRCGEKERSQTCHQGDLIRRN